MNERMRERERENEKERRTTKKNPNWIPFAQIINNFNRFRIAWLNCLSLFLMFVWNYCAIVIRIKFAN